MVTTDDIIISQRRWKSRAMGHAVYTALNAKLCALCEGASIRDQPKLPSSPEVLHLQCLIDLLVARQKVKQRSCGSEGNEVKVALNSNDRRVAARDAEIALSPFFNHAIYLSNFPCSDSLSCAYARSWGHRLKFLPNPV